MRKHSNDDVSLARRRCYLIRMPVFSIFASSLDRIRPVTGIVLLPIRNDPYKGTIPPRLDRPANQQIHSTPRGLAGALDPQGRVPLPIVPRLISLPLVH